MQLFSDRNLVKEITRRRKWNKIERNGTIGFVFVCAGVFFARAQKLVADIFADMFNILGAGVAILGIGGRRITDGDHKFLKDLSDGIEALIHEEFPINSLNDIEIVPKNIFIGDNLEASNAIELYQEGHYVLIRSKEKALVLRQLEENDKNHVEILDKIDAFDVLFDIVSNDNSGARKKFANDMINNIVDIDIEKKRRDDLEYHNALSKAFIDIGIEQAKTAELIIKDGFGVEQKIDVSKLLELREEIEEKEKGFIDTGIDVQELKGLGSNSEVSNDEAIGLSYEEELDGDGSGKQTLVKSLFPRIER